ncbi:MAG: PD-(D/E)XK nuclease family protein [Burkholderiales bacterium]
MAMQTQISAAFLADLDIVCPKADVGGLPLAFLKDVDAYPRASSRRQSVISMADLNSLAEDLSTWRRDYQQLLQKYLAMLPSDDPLRGQVSLFGAMDYGRLETAHTRTLAWLLDKKEHGFDYQLLEALLRYLLNGRQIHLTQVDQVVSEYSVYRGLARTEGGRFDVLARGRWKEKGKGVAWLLVIEAKIGAEEGEEQLSQYDDWLMRHAQQTEVLRVFLTPDGREPRTNSAKWQTLKFVELASVFRRVSGLHDTPGYHFLRYYLTGVLREICGYPASISPDSASPYSLVDYLKSVLNVGGTEEGHG